MMIAAIACGQEAENIGHVLGFCGLAMDLWVKSGISHRLNPYRFSDTQAWLQKAGLSIETSPFHDIS